MFDDPPLYRGMTIGYISIWIMIGNSSWQFLYSSEFPTGPGPPKALVSLPPKCKWSGAGAEHTPQVRERTVRTLRPGCLSSIFQGKIFCCLCYFSSNINTSSEMRGNKIKKKEVFSICVIHWETLLNYFIYIIYGCKVIFNFHLNIKCTARCPLCPRMLIYCTITITET